MTFGQYVNAWFDRQDLALSTMEDCRRTIEGHLLPHSRVGIGRAGRTVTAEQADTTFGIYHGDQLLAEVTRNTTETVARFKARKPEPPRRSSTTARRTETA